ncbi:MAG: HU family DNA-binding protein [Muribaculaceae bacterium]|nr:HU family DNA-binding protein [Muribaculaceae bacterium]
MNNKITMPALVALLALKSGLTKEKSEEFLREFFKLISDTLKEGESVKIKSLGTFKIMSVETRKSVNITNGEEIVIPGHNRIVFVASREIAEEINAPFSMFDSVELHPDAEEEIVASLETDNEREASKAPVNEEEFKVTVEDEGFKAPAQEEEANDLPKSEMKPIPEENRIEKGVAESEETAGEETNENPGEETDENSGEETEENSGEEPEETAGAETDEKGGDEADEAASQKKGKTGMKFIMGFVSGLVVAMLLAGAGYYFFIYKNGDILKDRSEDVPQQTVSPNDSVNKIVNSKNNEIIEEKVEGEEKKNDSAAALITPNEVTAEVDTQPSDRVVKDVIGPHNYLTTMAQRHYGDYNLWAFIYEENKSFLGHPDRIKPGTEVVVPPLSKYGIDPKNPEDVKKAKQLGIEIYKRYK